MPGRGDPFSRDSLSSGDGSLPGSFSAELDRSEDTESERSLLQADKPRFAYSGSLTLHGRTSSRLQAELELAREQEDPKRYLVATLVESGYWSCVVQTVICLNVLAMAVECDNGKWSCWTPINTAFLTFFLVELLGRVYVYRRSFFTLKGDRWWNIFDFTLVATGVVDEWLSSVFLSEEEERTVSFIKLFRILRVFRALRVVRHMPRLKMLIESFISSLQASVWIFLFFYFLIGLSGLLCAILVGRSRDDWPEGQRAEIDGSFGTMSMSMFTMFRFTTLDDWSATAAVVAMRLPVMPVFFAVYIIMTSYFVVALLTGVIFKQVLEHHNSEEVNTWRERRTQYLDDVKEKYRMEEQRRGHGFKGFTFRELWDQLELDKILHAGEENHVHVSMEDVQDFFKALDLSGDGMISWDEFKTGMDNMSGPVQRWTVVVLQGELRRILRRIEPGAAGGRNVPLEGTPQGHRREARLTALKARLDEIESLLKQVVRAGLGTPPPPLASAARF